MDIRRFSTLFFFVTPLLMQHAHAAEIYDASPRYEVTTVADLEMRDEKQKKMLPLRVSFPAKAEGKLPLIVWSHGAGGSRDNYLPLVEHWASRGYIVIQPTHGDSMKLLTPEQRKDENNLWKQWRSRVDDVRFILDSLDAIGAKIPAMPPVDRERLALGGHSFGAHTTMIVAGARLYPPFAAPLDLSDKRFKAFIYISPQGTGQMLKHDSYHGLTRPALMITGDNDYSLRNSQTPKWRMEVWDNIPSGDRWLVWIKDAHHNFGGIAGRVTYPGAGPLDEKQVKAVQAATLAFWDAQLKSSATAAAYLAGDVMEKATAGLAKSQQKR